MESDNRPDVETHLDEDDEFLARASKYVKDKKLNTPSQDTFDDDYWQSDEGRREYIRDQWAGETFPLTEQQLSELILTPEFGERVVDAIQRTDDWSNAIRRRSFGQEFGFVVYRNEGHIDPIHFSPIFAGDDRSINLTLHSDEYITQNPEVHSSRAVVFHTHPNAIRQHLLSGLVKNGEEARIPDSDCFSENDLKSFKQSALRDDLSLIYAVGLQHYDQESGKVIFLSINDIEKFMTLDPETIVKESREYKSANPGVPVDVYQRHGLNVAVLSVNLYEEAPFVSEEVAVASNVLVRRSR